MNRAPLSVPEIAIIGGTRALLGAGVGLLLADRMNDDERRAVGWTLVAIGAITTIPIAIQLFRSISDPTEPENQRQRSSKPDYAS